MCATAAPAGGLTRRCRATSSPSAAAARRPGSPISPATRIRGSLPLARLGIARVYTHQRQAWDAARAGRDFCRHHPDRVGQVALLQPAVFVVAVRESVGARALSLSDEGARARSGRRAAAARGGVRRTRARRRVYDGDTPADQRRAPRCARSSSPTPTCCTPASAAPRGVGPPSSPADPRRRRRASTPAARLFRRRGGQRAPPACAASPPFNGARRRCSRRRRPSATPESSRRRCSARSRPRGHLRDARPADRGCSSSTTRRWSTSALGLRASYLKAGREDHPRSPRRRGDDAGLHPLAPAPSRSSCATSTIHRSVTIARVRGYRGRLSP
jgi:hypothetical protein